MQRVSQGDEVAMGELYDRFIGLVFKSSRQVLTSRAEADDAVQETFIRLWQTADRFDPARAKLVTWVMLITRRHLIDRLRRRGARPEQLGLDGAAEFLGPTVEPAPEPGWRPRRRDPASTHRGTPGTAAGGDRADVPAGVHPPGGQRAARRTARNGQERAQSWIGSVARSHEVR